MREKLKGKQLYVGNLDYSVNAELLGELFAEFGSVTSIKVIKNRGFGFVEMLNPDDVNIAMNNLNYTEFFGRRNVIDYAKPKRIKWKKKQIN